MKGLLVALVLAASAVLIECPEDGSEAFFTGRTRTGSSGYQLWQYKCFEYGHLFWVRADAR